MSRGVKLNEIKDELVGLRSALDEVLDLLDQEIASSSPEAVASDRVLDRLRRISGGGIVLQGGDGPFLLQGNCWPNAGETNR